MKPFAIAAIAVTLTLAACRDSSAPAERPFTVAQQCRSHELGCPRPIFGVKNLKTSLAYYRDVLGFKIDWEYGEPADFASVTRGQATVFLGEHRTGGGGQLWVFAKHVDRLHDELRKRKAIITMPPTDMPWGSRELHVVDRDGNLLRFAGPTR